MSLGPDVVPFSQRWGALKPQTKQHKTVHATILRLYHAAALNLENSHTLLPTTLNLETLNPNTLKSYKIRESESETL